MNHPNIAAIYGLEETGSVRALVLELLEGPTLADRIARGPLPPDEALGIARQIADALEASHEVGVVHRDLKPANTKVRADGTVKVLDFGLAKALDPLPGAVDASQSPTITSPAVTRQGVVLGTAAYMSPEQARGHPVDRRSDIWAFGCVLYEMLTGRRVFDGEGATDVLARVLEREPDWTALPAKTPHPIRTLLKRCLEKDRRKRMADISTALFVFDDDSNVAEARGPQDPADTPKEVAEAQAQATRRRLTLVGVLTLLLGAAAAATGVWVMTRPASMPVTRLVLPISDATTLSLQGGDRELAITPDGTRLVYRSTNR